MLYPILKFGISALLIVLISELSRRSSLAGALLASLPITSLLAMIWLYRDTRDTEAIASLSIGIFWLVLPSLVLFPLLWWLLKKGMLFPGALAVACLATVAAYFLMLRLLKFWNISL